MGEISLLADKSAHRVVRRRLEADYPNGGQGAAMDAPCGAGAMSATLKKMGFAVGCYDIDDGNFEAGHLGLSVQVADLNRRLAVDDKAYDVVVSIAGIQRLFNPENALQEFGRVLKDGGRLYLSCPNFATLKRRVSFLLNGSLGLRFDRPSYRQTLDNPEANVRMPITLSRVKEILGAAGFEIEAVEGSYDQAYPFVFFPVTLFVMLGSLLRRIANPGRYARYGDGNTLKMLSSQNFLLVCRKRAAA
jgi:SAM-dependent methyltransferase